MNYFVLSSLVNINSHFFSVNWSSEFYCSSKPDLALFCFRLRTRHCTTPISRNIPEKASTRDKPSTNSIYLSYTSEDTGKYLHFLLRTSIRHHTTSGFDGSGTQQPFNIVPGSFFLKKPLVFRSSLPSSVGFLSAATSCAETEPCGRNLLALANCYLQKHNLCLFPPFILHQPLTDLPFPHSQNQTPSPCLISLKTWSSCSR